MMTWGLLLSFIGLLSMAVPGQFEEQYGIGVLLIHEEQSHGVYTVSLFDSIGEGQAHARWIELSWGSVGFWTRWEELLPFPIFNGSNEPFLVCTEQRGEWFRVRLKGRLDYWVRQEDRSHSRHGVERAYKKFELQTWAQFMENKAWVGRLDPALNPIRKRPRVNSDVIPFDQGDCLTPISVEGWWVEVEPHNGEGCITDTTSDETIFKKLYFDHGWVQWRNDSTFLLRTTY